MFWVFWQRTLGVLGVLAGRSRCSGHRPGVLEVFWAQAGCSGSVLGGAGARAQARARGAVQAWNTTQTWTQQDTGTDAGATRAHKGAGAHSSYIG